jgi:hypothetical protein
VPQRRHRGSQRRDRHQKIKKAYFFVSIMKKLEDFVVKKAHTIIG